MRDARFIHNQREASTLVEGPGSLRRVGIEKIKPDAGIGHHDGEQLLADTQPTTAFADIEMADATVPRLLAERIAV